MDTYDWLNALKPGDRVIVSARGSRSVKRVEKVTKFHIVVGGEKFSRTRFGRSLLGDSWSRKNLEEATNSAISTIKNKQQVADAKNLISLLRECMFRMTDAEVLDVSKLLRERGFDEKFTAKVRERK